MNKSNINVSIRVRPQIAREIQQQNVETLKIINNTAIEGRETMNSSIDDPNLFPTYRFNFDRIFDPQSTQEAVY